MRSLRHGTVGEYQNHGCRCPNCREAWRVRARDTRLARRRRGACWDCTQPAEAGCIRCWRHLDQQNAAQQRRVRRRRAQRTAA